MLLSQSSYRLDPQGRCLPVVETNQHHLTPRKTPSTPTQEMSGHIPTPTPTTPSRLVSVSSFLPLPCRNT